MMSLRRWLCGPGENEEITYKDLDVIKMPAFGRPFRLGMLYDRVNDTIIPGESLLELKDLENHTFTAKKQGCSFDVTYGDSVQEKSAVYKGDANLELNVLKGAASLGCSGKFLINNISKKNQLRVSLTAQYITLYKELAMTHFDSHISNTTTNATHIVTAIEYGANVTFTFDRIVSEEEDILQVKGELKGMIDKIPSFKISGHAEGSLGKSDEEKAKKISCTFCGDIILPVNPTTYEEAVLCYRNLPTYLKENLTVPVYVWLYPIHNQSIPGNQVLQIIDKEKMSRAVDVLEDLHKMYIECNYLMSGPAIPLIPNVKLKIDDFRKVLQQRRDDFQHQVLGDLLKECDLPKHNILQWKYEIQCMQKWISQNAEVEINLLNMYINEFKKGGVEVLAKTDVYTKLFEHDRMIVLEIVQDFSRGPYFKQPIDDSMLSWDEEWGFFVFLENDNDDHNIEKWYKTTDLKACIRNKVKGFVSLKSKNSYGFKFVVTFTDINETDDTSGYVFYINEREIKIHTDLLSDRDIEGVVEQTKWQ